MEQKEYIKIIITTLSTVLGIILVFLLNLLIKYLNKKHNLNLQEVKTGEITKLIIEAEEKLGAGQGSAKLNYVINKLNKKPTNKLINEINKQHLILKTAKNEIEAKNGKITNI